jgi:hypothetical protein
MMNNRLTRKDILATIMSALSGMKAIKSINVILSKVSSIV